MNICTKHVGVTFSAKKLYAPHTCQSWKIPHSVDNHEMEGHDSATALGNLDPSDTAQLCVGSAPEVSSGDSKLTLIPVLFTWHWFFFANQWYWEKEVNRIGTCLHYHTLLLGLLQRRNRRIKRNAQFDQTFQWVAYLLMAGVRTRWSPRSLPTQAILWFPRCWSPWAAWWWWRLPSQAQCPKRSSKGKSSLLHTLGWMLTQWCLALHALAELMQSLLEESNERSLCYIFKSFETNAVPCTISISSAKK